MNSTWPSSTTRKGERYQHWHRVVPDSIIWVRCDRKDLWVREEEEEGGRFSIWVASFGAHLFHFSLGDAVFAVENLYPRPRCACTPDQVLSWEIYLATQPP